MAPRHSQLYKPALGLAAALLLAAAGFLQSHLNRMRFDPALGLARVSPLATDKMPPLLSFVTVALGSFRGLIANVLWTRATDLQDEGKYFEMVQLADWITKLEPTFVQVWLVQAWNMTYNISVKFSAREDRWQWVQRGIELLRDEGLRYNPSEALIYRELAWFFQHKMGQNLDDAHLYYKTQWAWEMTRLFGGPRPNYAELLNPATEEARQRLERLKRRYQMDPRLMQETDTLYGPLEWRLPEAHAIYWAHVGLKHCTDDLITLRRAIYQSSQMSVLRGRVVRLPEQGNIETAPDLDKVKLASDNYEKMIAEEAEKRDAIERAHRSFLREAIFLLYLNGRAAEATSWIEYARGKYPDAIPPGMNAREYAFSRMIGDLASLSFDKTKGALEGLLVQGFRALALDDDDRGNKMLDLSRELYAFYLKQSGSQQQRLGMPPYERIQKDVLDAMISEESRLLPELKARLRTRFNLPAPAAPPTNALPGRPPAW